VLGHHEGCAAEGATKESLGKCRAAAGPIPAVELILGQYGFNLLLLFDGHVGGMMINVSNPALRGKALAVWIGLAPVLPAVIGFSQRHRPRYRRDGSV